jgi:hypothetical protein
MEEVLAGAGRAIVDAVLPLIITVFKVALGGAAICFFSQQTVEWAYTPVVKRLGLAAADTGERKRFAALGVGILIAMLMHWCDAPSFAVGPKGWLLASLAGFLGGGIAGRFRDWGEKKWFVPTRADAPPAAGGGS